MSADRRKEAIAIGKRGPKCDSVEGMTILAGWARAHRIVLSEAHEKLAIKHGVSLEGVAISRAVR
jgi:hypothetical protein